MALRVLDQPTRARSRTSMFQHVDVVLAFATLAVAAMGVVMVYSATRGKLELAGADPRFYLKKQLLYAIIGLAVMVVVMLIDYHQFEILGVFAYGAVLLGLLAVLSPLGSSARGSQRWFQVGSFQLQPSAFASLALILAIASYLRRRQGAIMLRHVVVLLLMAGIPIFLVYKQPDLGTAMVMAASLLVMMVVAGVKGRYLAALGLLAVLGIVAVAQLGVLKQYQVDRLTSFVHQTPAGQTTPAAQGSASSNNQSQQSTYNLAQSKIAIGSGGTTGKGLFNGSQTNLNYVPEQQTDFIFTAVGEQLGFLGAASLLALFGIIIWRVLRAAQTARDTFGTLLCGGVLGLIGLSVFQNAGMTMGIMPITGIPLPFMSYGGSATIAFFAAIGIVLNVGMRRFR
ncbi:MAG TPA: rod shape-determining protein RodA [Acidimicrobiales bacterium]|nr:rod shape-determining protein RodA [Acidimicrobiales bacterium]